MGRKKIQITRIQDERNRQITFSKRKAGLLKKAYELSILCDVEIAVIMITGGNKLYQYASTNMNSILIRYTEFKDPDESKTNADILDDINRRDKGNGRDGLSGDDDDDHTHLPLTPNTHAHYQRIDEEFDQVLRQENPIEHISPPQQQQQQQQQQQSHSIVFAASASIPHAMPVSVPVTSPDLRLKPIQHLGSAGSSQPSSISSSTMSPDTPGSRSIKSPSSVGSMPPPAGTPNRLQTIRNQTLKLHLPGGGRNYVSLPSNGSSPMIDDSNQSPSLTDVNNESQQQQQQQQQHSNRPQLKVVIPGQKGFVAKTTPATPPHIVDIETPPKTDKQSIVKPSTAISSLKNDSLTTPIMSLTTPSLFSSTLPALSNSEFPLSSIISGEGGGSTSALVAFPISIQPGAGNTPGNNLIIQAQNMGQPFLLTPTPSDKQNPALTPPTPYSSIKDLEQLKLQYDKIYQQISDTLQFHEQNKPSDDETQEVLVETNSLDVSNGSGQKRKHESFDNTSNKKSC